MRNIVGCRIKAVKTDLFCEIALGWDRGSVPFVWSRIENKLARLRVSKNGSWGIVSPAKYGPEIAVMELSPIKTNPDGSRTFKQIATLFDLPENFIDSAGCGSLLSGKGYWQLTLEPIEWELFYPCWLK